MAKFLTGNELNLEVERLFENAESKLILISPYIKLHERYLSVLKTKLNNDKLEIVIVFGKNEDDLSRSMKQEDFNFFREFPNIQIRHEKRLHAKYYCNDDTAILTSMNLYSFSQDNNIGAGVLTKWTLLADIASRIAVGEDTYDTQASNYFNRVIEQSELLFHKEPQYNNGLLGTGLGKRSTGSSIKVDKLSDFFSTNKASGLNKGNNEIIIKDLKKSFLNLNGYCIRTRKEIPFNPDKPFSDEAFQSWAKFGNEEYPEKYCHFSGDQSNGETTKAKPILRKYWNEAKKKFNL